MTTLPPAALASVAGGLFRTTGDKVIALLLASTFVAAVTSAIGDRARVLEQRKH
jgi:hypothetical protein